MKNNLQIKVCGMVKPDQIIQLAELDIDYIGMIFHTPSPRFLDKIIEPAAFGDKKKTGVFVNSPIEQILYTQSRHHLDTVQLHGSEPPEFCMQIQQRGIGVIKAFSIDKNFDFNKIADFDGYVDMFLFDAKGDAPGGNGIRFDWAKLNEYEGASPFLLSGGISYEHLDEISYFDHPAAMGIDINSKFEKSPGDKDLITLKKFIHELRG
ncbi:MAG: phosphoribosylanthranilate isomerase [Saprospiraceae bacterium]|nr:phosphoribosylanthranilate isomerase [Saprospiraceae bacterium]